MAYTTERRSGTDRRQLELGYPGILDRRRQVEQRKLEVLEITMSEAEWRMFFQPPRPSPATPSPAAPAHEEAAQVLERATHQRNWR